MHQLLYDCYSVDRYLWCIWIGAIMNRATVNTRPMSFSVNGRLTFSGADTQALVACSNFGFVVKVTTVSLSH